MGFANDSVRASYNLIIVFLWLFSVGFGALFFVALEHIVGADWSVPFRRITEILAGVVFIVPIIAIPLFLNLDQIFTWMNPEVLNADKYVKGKAPYLNESFFIIRNVAIFALMAVFFFLFTFRSFKQDTNKNPKSSKTSAKISAIFFPIFAISITVIGMDWMMSLEPKWFSTIFGVYYFAGSLLATLAVLTFVVITLKENGYLSKYITEDHYYNLGGLMFAFTNFWAYIAFSQFLLIWYANIPDETLWYMDRSEGGWLILSLGLIFIRFGIPYLALVTRPSKSNPFRLKIIAVWVFLAHYYDLYWMIMPEYAKRSGAEAPVFGLTELSAPFLVVGSILLILGLLSKNRNLMPVGDPKFKRSLEFHL
ncbi:MAG: quinol:cytochrome C oxidoreductase [Candidatus Kapabacteria bacterium]|nr:quinol:cytochrome C oxidoreductase [Ignavibacteriota bacterium]MCW5885320.1 quinol:cytochrome C oxidoreductase [Candidatus Kapabacteria bacterium]